MTSIPSNHPMRRELANMPDKVDLDVGFSDFMSGKDSVIAVATHDDLPVGSFPITDHYTETTLIDLSNRQAVDFEKLSPSYVVPEYSVAPIETQLVQRGQVSTLYTETDLIDVAVDVEKFSPSCDVSEYSVVPIAFQLGQRDQISTPWRLTPGYGMDYLNAIRNGVEVVDGNHRLPKQQIQPAVDASAIPIRSRTAVSLNSNAVSYIPDSGYSALFDYFGTEATDKDRQLVSTPFLSASHVQWAKFMLRWTTNSDGSDTVWVRDYTLTPEQTLEAVSAIRTAANDANENLGRIMVNGTVVWSDQEALDENGDTPCR